MRCLGLYTIYCGYSMTVEAAHGRSENCTTHASSIPDAWDQVESHLRVDGYNAKNRKKKINSP